LITSYYCIVKTKINKSLKLSLFRASNVPTDVMLHDKKQIPLRQDTLLRSIYLKRGPQPGPAAIARIRQSPAGTRSSAAPSLEENKKETKKKNSCVAMWKQDFPVKLTKANYFPSNVKTKSISLEEKFKPVHSLH
jgi:hypothetical protein